MSDPSIVVQTLRDLGITRTEAEVYLATLREAGGGPVSGYRVAQSVGKDPANLSKTLASLEKLGAVRTIQDKPKLFIPIPPEDFTNQLLAEMRGNQLKVLDQLSDLDITSPIGIPMALHDREQTIQKTAQLLTRCRHELLIFAAAEVLKSLGTALEALVASSEITVNVLCLEELEWSGLKQKVVNLPVGFSDPEPVPWVQMVIDRRTWLVASFPSTGAQKQPCGWWSEDPSLALIMGASLAAAMESPVEVSVEIPSIVGIVPEPEPELQKEPEERAEVIEEPKLGNENIPPTKVETRSPDQPQTQVEDDDSDGIQFIIRHDEDLGE